jgi:UDP-N-acetylmuramoyl-tripeptide--D-alanyl-D-alanine ligase
LSIAESLTPDGVLLINADFSQLTNTCRAKGTPFLAFGKSDDADYQARSITSDGQAGRFTINDKQIHLPLAGLGNVENALAAWAICSQFGLTLDDFAQAVKTVPPVSMRSELLQIGTLTVLNDCYNANPDSMKNALDTLCSLDPDKKRRMVFICGDMAELGPQAEHLHAELGACIAQAGVKLLLAVGAFAKVAAQTAKNAAKYNLQIECFEDTLSACNNLHKFIKNYDIILVKGSRVARLEMAVEKLISLFS